MTIFKNWKFYDPDDTGDGGDGKDTAKPDQSAILADSLKSVVDTFKAEIAAVRTAAPAPVKTEPVVDPRAALEARAQAVAKEVNELAANGDLAGGMAKFAQFQAEAAQFGRPDPNNDPLVKAGTNLGKRLAVKEHKEIFDKWGTEVEEIVNAMPVTDRIQPDAWDRAVSQVQTRHFQELRDEAVAAAVEEEIKKRFGNAPPSAPGSRGKGANAGAQVNLDEDELFFANLMGVSAEAYAKNKKAADDWDKKPFSERGRDRGYPLVPQTVTPGRF